MTIGWKTPMIRNVANPIIIPVRLIFPLKFAANIVKMRFNASCILASASVMSGKSDLTR